jgi:hypothetical protein
MSFRRFLQHDILKRTKNGHEVLRLVILITKNILENPWNESYNRVRIVKIKTLSYEDILILQDILVMLGFIKKVEEYEEIFNLVKFERLDYSKLDDLNYAITPLKPVPKIIDNTSDVKKLLEEKKQAVNAILIQSKEDRVNVTERWNREYVKLLNSQKLKRR